jgi:hypothetical protein
MAVQYLQHWYINYMHAVRLQFRGAHIPVAMNLVYFCGFSCDKKSYIGCYIGYLSKEDSQEQVAVSLAALTSAPLLLLLLLSCAAVKVPLMSYSSACLLP